MARFYLPINKMANNIHDLRRISKVIARFVRDSLEDLHSKWVVMNDENMPEINRCIRKWVYEYYYSLVTLDPDQFMKIIRFKEPPKYREDDVFDEVEKSVDKVKKMLEK